MYKKTGGREPLFADNSLCHWVQVILQHVGIVKSLRRKLQVYKGLNGVMFGDHYNQQGLIKDLMNLSKVKK